MSTPTEAERREELRQAIVKAAFPSATRMSIRELLEGDYPSDIFNVDSVDRILAWHLAELDKALGALEEPYSPGDLL